MSALLALLLAAPALAQDDPTYDGVEAPAEEKEKPETDLSATLGGAWTTGNAVVINVIAGLDFKHRWQQNRFSALAGTNLNLAKIDTDGNGTLDDAERAQDLEWTSQYVNGALRYDRFFGERDSIYVKAAGERDQLAGLLYRFNEQFGYARALVKTDATNLDLETGLAYTQENFATGTDDDGNPINTEILDAHYLALRVFLGFSHAFNDNVSISDDLEMIEPLVGSFPDGTTNFEDFRLTNVFGLTTRLSDRFSIKLTHNLRFDNQPVPGFRKLDQTTGVTLVASIF